MRKYTLDDFTKLVRLIMLFHLRLSRESRFR
jgi:hypothetical protein